MHARELSRNCYRVPALGAHGYQGTRGPGHPGSRSRRQEPHCREHASGHGRNSHHDTGMHTRRAGTLFWQEISHLIRVCRSISGVTRVPPGTSGGHPGYLLLPL
eukprot:2421704-Rhodomonas_salina.1